MCKQTCVTSTASQPAESLQDTHQMDNDVEVIQEVGSRSEALGRRVMRLARMASAIHMQQSATQMGHGQGTTDTVDNCHATPEGTRSARMLERHTHTSLESLQEIQIGEVCR